MKPLRLLAGVGLGLLLVGILWFGGWVPPPEGLARRMAAYAAVYPGPVGAARVEAIPCPVLRRVRFYHVCTDECREVSRLMAVKGLQATLLANLGRIPPESLAITRRRINGVVGREALRLDADAAREMAVFYLRVEGLFPELVLSEGEVAEVEAARAEGEEAMRRLMDPIVGADPLQRIAIVETPEGFESKMIYWDTSRPGAPLLRLRLRLARDGQVRDLRAAILSGEGRAGRPAGEAVPGASDD